MSETAIVVAIPAAEPLVASWRERHTRDGAEGMPAHVTLLNPFLDSERLGEEEMRLLESALRGFEPVEVAFRETATFPAPNELVLWLRPEPAEPFVRMSEALMQAFPSHPPYGGCHDEIVPHLTIAHGEDELLARIRAELAPALPLKAHVTGASLFEHQATGWRPGGAFSFKRGLSG